MVFAALVVINSSVQLPAAIPKAASTLSSWCLVTAIAALGMITSFRDLFQVGWKPLVLLVAETAWICGVVLITVVAL
jgi:uncharacterized membrane protein YadS